MIVCVPCRRNALYIWKSRQGKGATYRALMDVFVRAGRLDCAETIVGILKEETETGKLLDLHTFLKRGGLFMHT